MPRHQREAAINHELPKVVGMANPREHPIFDQTGFEPEREVLLRIRPDHQRDAQRVDNDRKGEPGEILKPFGDA